MTNTPNPVPLDRDDPEARRQSVEFQWNALRQLFPRLPTLDRLSVTDSPEIARAILKQVSINRARSGAVMTSMMSDTEMVRRYQERERETQNSGTVSIAGAQQYEQAEAWLKTVYEIIDNQDIRQLIDRSPAAITTVTNRQRWTPVAVVDLPGLPGRPRLVSIDLENNVWRSGNADRVRQQLIGMTALQAGITLNPVIRDEALTDADVTEIFRSRAEIADPNLPRDPSNPRTTPMIQSNLSDALNRRARITALTSGNANSRELMMALATLQRDPSAINALNVGGNEAQQIQNDLDQNRTLLRAATIVEGVRSANLPPYNLPQIQTTITELQGGVREIRRHRRIASDPTPTPIHLYGGLSAAIVNELRAGGVEPDSERAYEVDGRGREIQNNWDELQGVIRNAENLIRTFQQREEAVNNFQRILNQMVAILGARGIGHGVVVPATYPQLHALITDGIDPPGAFDVPRNVNAITNAQDVQLIAEEFRRLLRDGNPENRVVLQDVNFYQNRERELDQRLSSSLAQVNQPINGSDACWAIIRRGLANELRLSEASPEVGNIINVTRTISDRTNRTRAAIEELTRRSVPPFRGAADAEAQQDWNNNESRRFRNRFGSRADVWHDYRDRLFDENHIRIRPGENPMQRRFSLNEVVDTYFQVNYLMHREPNEKLRLPRSQEMYAFLRSLRSAIVDRSQEGYYTQLGLTEEEMRAAQEAAGETPRQRHPDSVQRITEVNRIFDLEDRYIEAMGNQLSEMAEDAYRPVQQREDNRNWWNSHIWHPLGGFMRSAPGSTVRGIRTGATWPFKKAGDGIRRNKEGIGIGAFIGTAVAPGFGTVIGLGAGWAGQAALRWFNKPVAGDSSASA